MKVLICNNELSAVLAAIMAARARLKQREKDIPGLSLLKLMKICEALYQLEMQFQAVLETCKQQYVQKDEDGGYKVTQQPGGMAFQCISDEAAGELKKVLTAENEVDLQYLLDDEDLRHLPLKMEELKYIERITHAGAIRPGGNEKEDS